MDYQKLEEEVQNLSEEFERIATEPLETATVTKIRAKDMLVHTSKGPMVVGVPPEHLVPGDPILIHRSSGQYVRKNPFPNEGSVVVVSEVMEDVATVELDGRTKLIPVVKDLKAGDKVVLDEYAAFINRILPRSTKEYSAAATGVSWDDIGGNAHAKQAMIEAIEHPHRYKELFTHYGSKGTKGILLYGPPGCGKTMLGKAAATSIGSIEGFIYCKGPEVLDPYVGVTEATIRGLFTRARSYQERTDKRAVIFIDEAEALLSHRGGRNAYMEKTIIPTFLAEMDGVEDSGAVVILATNRPTDLDAAVVRDGRIDRKIGIARPNKGDSLEILLTHFRKVPLSAELDELCGYTNERVWEGIFQHSGRDIPLHSYVSGSMLAGIVEKAKANAMRRDIENKTMSGICTPDIDESLALTISEMGATTLESV